MSAITSGLPSFLSSLPPAQAQALQDHVRTVVVELSKAAALATTLLHGYLLQASVDNIRSLHVVQDNEDEDQDDDGDNEDQDED